jgi:hypothetical protein
MTLKYNCALHEVLKNLLPGVVAVIFILKDSFFTFTTMKAFSYTSISFELHNYPMLFLFFLFYRSGNRG